MNKKVWIVVMIITMAIVFGLLAVRATVNRSNTVTIGVLLPLSGDARVYGEEMQKGIELAMAEYRNSSKKQRPISIIIEDDAGQAKTSVSGFRKLVDLDHAQAVIGGAMSSTAMPIAPIAREKEVVLISPAASTPKLCTPGGYVFRVWPSDTYEANALGRLAIEKLKLRTAAVLYVNNDYGAGASEIFVKAFEKAGGTILLNEGYQQGTTDFRTTLTKLRTIGPQAVYVPGYYKELAALLKQARELDFKTQFLGGVGFQEPKILELAAEAAEGTIYTTPFYDTESQSATTRRFVKAFSSRYDAPPGIFAAHAYDATRILLEAINSSDGTGKSIRVSLLKVHEFPGAAGDITFTEMGDVVKPVAFHMVKNGKFVPFKPN